jgi:predicted DNA-binding protein
MYTLGMAARRREATEHQLHIKITAAQWERLQKLAAALGLTPSAYVRQHIATAVAK